MSFKMFFKLFLEFLVALNFYEVPAVRTHKHKDFRAYSVLLFGVFIASFLFIYLFIYCLIVVLYFLLDSLLTA